jgi:adenylate cyclase
MKPNNYKYESAVKAINYLSNKGWEFETIRGAANDFKKAFHDGDPCFLVDGIVYLLTKCKNWGFFSFNDIQRLEEARRVYRKSLMRYEAHRQQRDW